VALKRAVSSISDEIKLNSVLGKYNPVKAQQKAYKRRWYAGFRGKKIVANDALRSFVDTALNDGQSAAGISGRIENHEKHLPTVSKDTVYRYLKSAYGKLIGIKWKKRIRRKKPPKVTKLKDRVFIDKRPETINNRERVGDLEADFIVSGKSGKGVLLTVVCRKLRVAFLELILDVSIDEVHLAFERIKERFPEMLTITMDNDILFKMHKTLEILLKVLIYFCHPYHSWEKGSIENVNGEVRKFIPKGSDLSQYSQEEIREIEQHINGRYMECLNFKTPQEMLDEYRQNAKKPPV